MTYKDTKTEGIQPYVIEVMCLRLSEVEALSYLSNKGYDISRSELYRLKQEIKENTTTRLNLVASEEFLSQHIERIDTLNTVHNELWIQYKAEQNPTNKSKILMQIAELQQVLSAFYDSTQYVMQQSAHMKKRKKLEQQ